MSNISCILNQYLPIIKDGAITGAAITGIYVGLKGLSAWDRQLKGKVEYELAKQLLQSVYELRVAISSVRHPFMSYSQEPDLPKEELEKLTLAEKRHQSLGQAYTKRWEPVLEARATFDSALLEAEVVWGGKMLDLGKPLRECIQELALAIKTFIEMNNPKQDNQGLLLQGKKDQDFIMYEIFDAEKNQYTKKIQEAITAFEKNLRPHIERYHNVHEEK